MELSLLFPVFLAGASAVAAPIWLHLYRRPIANRVLFSGLQFLDDQPLARSQPLRLRDWVLFLARTAALLFVVASFAWPYFSDARSEQVLSESRVFILDSTLSHQVQNDWHRDRDRIIGEIESAAPHVQTAVVELTTLPRVVVHFGDDPVAAASQLAELQPSAQRGSYLAAFRLAASLLEQSLGERRRIIFLSDSQENQWGDGLQSPPFLAQLEVLLPELTRTSAANLAVSEPQLRRVFSGERSIIDCMFKVYWQGPAKSATVTVVENGNEILRRTFDLPKPAPKDDVGESGSPVDSALAPTGQTLWLFTQWPNNPSLHVRGSIRILGEPDSLAGDNEVTFSLPPLREGRLALLAQSPFLETALSPDVMKGRWRVTQLDPTRMPSLMDGNAEQDVLCMESQYLQAQHGRDLLLGYLKHGRGVVLILDRVTPISRGCLRELGIEIERDVECPAGRQALGFVHREHPVLLPFRSAEFGDLSEIRIRRFRRLRAPNAVPLLFASTGDLLLFESSRSENRLFVVAFAFDRTESNWPTHPTFVPLLDLLLQNVRAVDSIPGNFAPCDAYVLRLPTDRKVSQVRLRSDSAELSRFEVQNGRAELRLPETPGAYALCLNDSEEAEHYLCVNPPPDESRLSYIADPEALKAWTVDPSTITDKQSAEASADPRVELTKAEALQQRLWWWLLLAAGALLVCESICLATRKGQP